MSAAAVALSGSAASAAAVVLRVPVVRLVAALLVPVVRPVAVPHGPRLRVPVPRAAQLPVLAPAVLLAVRPDLLLNLLSIRLPRAAVESEALARLRVRPSFSAATARSSPPMGKPTQSRAASTRSPPNGRP